MNDTILKDIIQWDVGSWSVILDYWEKQIEWNKVRLALELGAREGGLSLWLALKNIQVVCSDIENPVSTAQGLHHQYNISSLISYAKIDATNIPYQDHFDIIAFKSILGGIGRNNNFLNQQKVISEIHKALKPNGMLLFAENLKASLIHQFMRKKFVKWGNDWRYLSIKEIELLLKPFSYFEIKTNGVIATFGRTERQRNILSGVDKLLLNKICPERWKYIGYGIAVK